MYVTNFYIGYLLSRLVYTYKSNRTYVFVKNTTQIRELFEFLWRKGFICSFFICDSFKIKVYIKYFQGTPIFSSFVIISSPSKRVFYDLDKLNSLSTRHLFVVSTNKGLFTPLECISMGLG